MIEELSTDILQESELPEPYVSENALKVLKNRYLKNRILFNNTVFFILFYF